MNKAVLLDTSILVRERATGDPHHRSTTEAVASLIREDWTLYLAPQCLIEFWSVATRPAEARGGLGLSLTETQAAVEDFIADRILLPEPTNLFELWFSLVKTYGVLGRQVWDARIVAWMQAYGVTYLLTCNPTDFTRYTEIAAYHPDQVEELIRTAQNEPSGGF
ncbi:MAG: hypothetical protein N2554_01660 [Fimbriimonadales bacterium]|nr:hypothetical protein [Fimbriimonadales bacterium]